MIAELIENKCIQIGNFKLKNGDTSKYYFDMKSLVSFPNLLKRIGDELYKKLDDFDIICGIPYGGLPIAVYISTTYNKPLIYIRDKAKSYGTQKLIEGNYKKTDKCLIIDDVITSGGSIQEAIDILQDKVTLVQTAVIFDRQQNHTCTMPVTSLLNKTDVVKYRLQNIVKKKNSTLCFAADLSDYAKLFNIIEKLSNEIVICKIHFDTVPLNRRDTFRERLIQASIQHDFLIMEDRKFNDISHIVKQQYREFQNWVDLVTVHTLVTNEVVKSLSGVVLVANMSNNNYDFSGKAYELAKTNHERVIGFVTQKRIPEEVEDPRFICMTPGISTVVTRIGDQQYRTKDDVDTDIHIIGRAIYNDTQYK